MASALLSLSDLKVALGVTTTDNDAQYAQIIDDVQAILEGQCSRSTRPFASAVDARTEVFDGNGHTELLLDYPIRALTSVVLGADVSDPDETLDVADRDVLRFGVGRCRLLRVDGGVFGALGDPRVVTVTYATDPDLPRAARAAVLAGCRIIINRLGAEGVSAERIGAYSVEYANFVTADVANDPVWKLGVEAGWDPRL